MILDELNDENPRDNLITYLTDANPYMRLGESSVDEVVYDEFRNKFNNTNKINDYYYDFICQYLKELDPYYGDIFNIFTELTRDDYIDTCENIINNYSELFKKYVN